MLEAGTDNTARGLHIIFVLDESRSMHGTPWTQTQKAYKEFVRVRAEKQAQHDLVSLIHFSKRANPQWELQTLAFATKQTPVFHDGGTRFCPALDEATKCLGKTPVGKTPVMIFMS